MNVKAYIPAALILLCILPCKVLSQTPVANMLDFSARPRLETTEEDPLSVHDGKIIREIHISVRDVFEDADNWLYKNVNSFKPKTREQTIRQELFFEEGQPFSAFAVRESIRILRLRRYLRRFDVEVIDLGAGEVDVHMNLQDTWTLIPQFSFSSGDGRNKLAAGMAESNLMGFGKRVEGLYEEDDGRQSLSGIYDDPRIFGSDYNLLAGYFDRNDGEASILSFGRPFRTLLDKEAWGFSSEASETIGRLFANGDERYIFGQQKVDLNLRYTFSTGNPQVRRRRFSFGYRYTDRDFSQADLEDYDALNLNPAEVSNDPNSLAEDRRFSGPTFNFSSITPDFIPMNYIDRFDRVEEYNLGSSKSLFLHYAPEFLGSLDDALLFGGGYSRGYAFDEKSFIRGELSFSSRAVSSELVDCIIHAELKYYKLLGDLHVGDLHLGRHTFASSFYIDYGDNLDLDREFLIGGDNAIRGYTARTFPGDKRYALNIEERFHLYENLLELISLGGAFFFDIGGATHENLGSLFTDESYADVGAGLRLGFPRSSGGKVFRVDLAFPLRDGPDDSKQFEPRLIFSGGQLFSSFLRSETLGQERASLELGFDD